MFQVRALLQHAQRVQRLHAAQATGRDGENFNLFHLLGIGHLEVSTHSRILCDLLDPRGSHGQGAVFLKHFVQRLELPHFDFENAEITPEVSIGPVTETSGGRIDLVISVGHQELILIENKIFAGEQDNWVSRYLGHAPSATLVFLTLRGHEPKDMPAIRPPGLKCASYRSHITDWLQDCRKEAVTAPIVRESISQYLHLVQELTQQSQRPFMIEELVKAATENRESLDAYYALRNIERDIQAKVLRSMEDELKRIAEENGFTFQPSLNSDYSAKGNGFAFHRDDLEPLHIRFEFDKSGYREFALGFVDGGKLPTEERRLLRDLFSQAYGSAQSNEMWPAWAYPSAYQNWAIGRAFVEIQFGNFINDIERELKQLADIASKLRGFRPSPPQP